MDKNLPYYLGFSYCYGIGPVRFNALCSEFTDLPSAYNASVKDLRKVLDEKRAQDFDSFRQSFNPKAVIKSLKQKEITVLTRDDPRYPPQIRQISDAPICLYVKGDLRKFDFAKERFFGIVGTRRPTSYGKHIATSFSRELSSHMVIVSGLALGVDGAAHEAALENGGKTIAFVGCGVDIVYPSSHKKLYENIIASDGLVMSEFPPGHTVMRGLFVARNRLISGLSQGILVVEGTKDSGSLITARYAAEQGKEVFAPPVPITSSLSEAPNILLKEGAQLVTSPKDILEAFNIRAKAGKLVKKVELEGDEGKIYELLLKEPLSADEISVAIKIPISSLLQLLSAMEMQEYIMQSDGKFEAVT